MMLSCLYEMQLRDATKHSAALLSEVTQTGKTSTEKMFFHTKFLAILCKIHICGMPPTVLGKKGFFFIFLFLPLLRPYRPLSVVSADC